MSAVTSLPCKSGRGLFGGIGAPARQIGFGNVSVCSIPLLPQERGHLNWWGLGVEGALLQHIYPVSPDDRRGFEIGGSESSEALRTDCALGIRCMS